MDHARGLRGSPKRRVCLDEPDLAFVRALLRLGCAISGATDELPCEYSRAHGAIELELGCRDRRRGPGRAVRRARARPRVSPRTAVRYRHTAQLGIQGNAR